MYQRWYCKYFSDSDVTRGDLRHLREHTNPVRYIRAAARAGLQTPRARRARLVAALEHHAIWLGEAHVALVGVGGCSELLLVLAALRLSDLGGNSLKPLYG